MTATAAQAKQVAELLRSRRERLQPGDVGLPNGIRRRARGLRREEVAQLASISTTYYTFLEQGRDLHPSRQVLDALARALRLDTAERAHLHQLVHGVAAADPPAGGEELDGAVADLVERLDPFPTYVTGRCWDVLAANRAARALWIDWPALPAEERNMLWWTFTAPEARSVFVDWTSEAQALLARFRLASARFPGDPQFASLTERLQEASADARAWWPRHDIAPLSPGTKRLRHPELGVVELTYAVLQVAQAPEQKVVTFTADASDQERIAGLLAHTRG